TEIARGRMMTVTNLSATQDSRARHAEALSAPNPELPHVGDIHHHPAHDPGALIARGSLDHAVQPHGCAGAGQQAAGEIVILRGSAGAAAEPEEGVPIFGVGVGAPEPFAVPILDGMTEQSLGLRTDVGESPGLQIQLPGNYFGCFHELLKAVVTLFEL